MSQNRYPIELGDLNDVDLSGKTASMFLRFDGTKWIAESVAISSITTLTALDDVDVSSPADGDVLTYNTATQKWENAVASGGGGATDWDDITGDGTPTGAAATLLIGSDSVKGRLYKNDAYFFVDTADGATSARIAIGDALSKALFFDAESVFFRPIGGASNSITFSDIGADPSLQVPDSLRISDNGVAHVFRFSVNSGSRWLAPETDSGATLGESTSARRWGKLYLGASGEVYVNGNKVLGARQTAPTPISATTVDSSYGAPEAGVINSLRTTLNEVLTVLANHGLTA